MWSFPGSYSNRGSGTQQASSDVVPVVGLDLRCGAGQVAALGRPPAPHSLPLPFESRS